MKWIKKHWFKILSIILILILGIYILSVGIKKARDHEIYKEPSPDTKIYTVWHVETFEGGGKSRLDYLKNVARSIEKDNPGVLFFIKQIDADNLQTELASSVPDIISFGYGVGKIVLPFLQSFDSTFDIRDELIESATFNNKIYALPFIVSGYAMITHGTQTNNFHCGTTGFTSPEMIYNDYQFSPAEVESQYEAYKDFVYNTDVTLLGTGRDVFRVNNLNKIGRANAIITPIDTYTDLIQYIGITNIDENIISFYSALLSNERQYNLSEYSLFSSKYDKIYFSGIYSDMEDAIYSCNIPNVFQ